MTDAADDRVLYEVRDRVARLTINRPDKLNALDRRTMEAIDRAVGRARDDGEVGVLIVTGAGDKAFVAGADIGELNTQDPVTGAAYARWGQSVLDRLERCGKPSIALIKGYAFGGGLELAMACTLRLASDTALLGQPEIDLGLLPGFGGTQRLPRLVGRGRALDLLLTGRRVDAAEAERIGLVNRVVPAAELLTEARALARSLAAKPAAALRYILAAVHGGADLSFEAASQMEATLFGLVASTPDMHEGTRAFLEKRKPQFAR